MNRVTLDSWHIWIINLEEYSRFIINLVTGDILLSGGEGLITCRTN